MSINRHLQDRFDTLSFGGSSQGLSRAHSGQVQLISPRY